MDLSDSRDNTSVEFDVSGHGPSRLDRPPPLRITVKLSQAKDNDVQTNFVSLMVAR